MGVNSISDYMTDKQYQRGHIIEGRINDILNDNDTPLATRISDALDYIRFVSIHSHSHRVLAEHHFFQWLIRHNIKDEYMVEQL